MHAGDVVAGRFELLDTVGSGGMSAVWRASDRHDGSIVAVKIAEITGATALERFSREAHILSSLHHPHVVRHVAHGSVGLGTVFLAMEMLEGESLDARLARGTLPIRDTLRLGVCIAEALGVAHERGVLHRDVTPTNVFLVDDDVARATLLDFGVARLGGARSLTVPGQPLGTPVYMAPEQARDDADHNAAVDVHGLGCVMFECLAGRPAYRAANMVAVLAKVLFEPPPRLSDVRSDTPPALDRLLARMLAKRPEDRYRDGSAAAAAIDALLVEEPARLSSVPPRPSLYPQLDEGRLLSVVLLVDPGLEQAASTRTPGELRSWRREVEAIAARAGGYAEQLSQGSPVIVLPTSGSAVTHACAAVEVARELRQAIAALAIGVSTIAVSEGEPRAPVGAAIDEASAMLAQASAGELRPGTIVVDATTARLVAGRVALSLWGAYHRIDDG